MSYAIIIWIILVISTGWLIYEGIHVKQVSFSSQKSNPTIKNEIILRSHAKLLLGFVVLWWFVHILTSMLYVQYSVSLDFTTTVVLMVGLTPLFTYIFCAVKCRIQKTTLMACIKSYTGISWILNILTALLYASLINYSIQMILIF